MPVSISGSGQVPVQVIQTVKTDTFTTTSAMPTFVDVTGVSATITPTSSSNKVLVTVTGYWGVSTANYSAGFNLVRGSTSIAIGDSRGSSTRGFAGALISSTVSAATFTVCFLDSPATTSATTYKIQAAIESGATLTVGGSSRSDISSTISTPTIITLMEISGT
jgi:hypothetical protein